MEIFQLSKKWFFDALFPLTCVGCGKEDVAACGDCLAVTPFFVSVGCPWCEKAAVDNFRLCAACGDVGLAGLFCGYPYRHPAVKGVVRGLKFEYNEELRASLLILTDRFLVKVKALLPSGEDVVVVGVPTTGSRRRERGFDQVGWIVDRVATICGVQRVAGLELRRDHELQSKIEAHDAREKNIRGAFRATSAVVGKRVILVDDVFTSGATMREAAQALRSAGAIKVWGFAFAKSGKKKDDPKEKS